MTMSETKTGAPAEAPLINEATQDYQNKAVPSIAPADDIRALLPKAVLIPVRRNTKKALPNEWQMITLEQTNNANFTFSAFGQKLHYASAFAKNNIGVSLGKCSGGLCTIDIDTDGELEPFLKLNPRLRDTLISARVRGANIWIQVEGEYPRNKPITTSSGAKWGEWRADGNLTLIHGQAMDKRHGETKPTRYKIVNRVTPISIRYDEIAWPEHVMAPVKHGKQRCLTNNTPQPPILFVCNPETLQPSNPETLNACIPFHLYNNENLAPVERLQMQQAGQDEFERRFKKLLPIYEKFIQPKFRASKGSRNGFLVEVVPFLFRTVGINVGLELVLHYYMINSALFKDSFANHLKEAKAMFQGVSETYMNELSPDERGFYLMLDNRKRDAFRICRDLALYPKPSGKSPLSFHLGSGHLAIRLGENTKDMEAYRILEEFCGAGVLEQLEKGKAWKKDEEPVASRYKWLLPTGKAMLQPANS
jgi:hypothetical protein